MISPDALKSRLQSDERLILMNSNMNPDDPRQGQAQFLVSVAYEEAEVISEYNALDVLVTGEHTPNPDQYHVAIPPETEA